MMPEILNRMFEHMATKSEVYESLGPEMGKLLIEERRIVFWKYGIPIGAFLGTSIIFILIYIKQLVGIL